MKKLFCLVLVLTGCSLNSAPGASLEGAQWIHDAKILKIATEPGSGGGVFPVSIPYNVIVPSGEVLTLYLTDYGQTGWPQVGQVCGFEVIQTDQLTGIVSEYAKPPPYYEVYQLNCSQTSPTSREQENTGDSHPRVCHKTEASPLRVCAWQ